MTKCRTIRQKPITARGQGKRKGVPGLFCVNREAHDEGAEAIGAKAIPDPTLSGLGPSRAKHLQAMQSGIGSG